MSGEIEEHITCALVFTQGSAVRTMGVTIGPEIMEHLFVLYISEHDLAFYETRFILGFTEAGDLHGEHTPMLVVKCDNLLESLFGVKQFLMQDLKMLISTLVC